VGATEADLFDVAVDKELAGYNKSNNKSSDRSGPGRGGPNTKRQKKNEKYGFGGKKRHAKSGDAVSSSDLSGFDSKKMKAKGRVSKTRPGKSRRQAMAGR
jgi:rRNA-processing protein EBP2